MAPPNQAGLIRQKVLGVNGAARNNVIWEPNSGVYHSYVLLLQFEMANVANVAACMYIDVHSFVYRYVFSTT